MRRDKEIEVIRRQLTELNKTQQHIQEQINRLSSRIGELEGGEKAEAPHTETPPPAEIKKSPGPKRKTIDWESYIGGNLINKVGIIALIVGVAIFLKHAIEHNLFSPVFRIVSGYAAGLCLLLTALKFFKKHRHYSAVVFSGGIAILYFTTFAAYAYYGYFNQTLALLFLILLTFGAVAAAFKYNAQVVGIYGLVGAYAAPFIVGSGQESYMLLFSYMTVINAGALVIAFIKYWRGLNLASFVFSWIIYLFWYYFIDSSADPVQASLFLTIFFTIFYCANLAYKLQNDRPLAWRDVVLLLLNSFIFYGVGYSILTDWGKDEFKGLFTLINAAVHFLALILIDRRNVDKAVVRFVAGLALTFLTIAVPVQLNGAWVTLLWAGEAVFLIRIGRSGKGFFYEKLGYALSLLSLGSLVVSWLSNYHVFPGIDDKPVATLMNVYFLTSLWCIAAFSFIVYQMRTNRYPESMYKEKPLIANWEKLMPVLLISLIYFTFFVEIINYWNQKSAIQAPQAAAMTAYNQLSLIIYTLLFFTTCVYLSRRYFSSGRLSKNIAVAGVIVFAIALLGGVTALDQLQRAKIDIIDGPRFFVLRYLFYLSLVAAFYAYNRRQLSGHIKWITESGGLIMFHFSILTLLSVEAAYWTLRITALAGLLQKIIVSILWTIYAVFLIAYGFRKKERALRIFAFIIIGAAVAKILLLDLHAIPAFAKVVVMVALGMLLLLASYFYQRFLKPDR